MRISYSLWNFPYFILPTVILEKELVKYDSLAGCVEGAYLGIKSQRQSPESRIWWTLAHWFFFLNDRTSGSSYKSKISIRISREGKRIAEQELRISGDWDPRQENQADDFGTIGRRSVLGHKGHWSRRRSGYSPEGYTGDFSCNISVYVVTNYINLSSRTYIQMCLKIAIGLYLL